MSAYGNQKAAFAAPRLSAHHKDDLWHRVRLAPHLSHTILALAIFEQLALVARNIIPIMTQLVLHILMDKRF